MALNAYLFLKANGADIQGDPINQNMGGDDVLNSIEAMAFYHDVSTETEKGTGGALASARRSHGPITFVKRIDRSTPPLYDAWARNKTIEGEIKFYQPASDTGQMEQHYTITITGGRIVSVRTEMLNNNFAEGGAIPVMERVSIVYNTIEWAFSGQTGATEAADDWESTV